MEYNTVMAGQKTLDKLKDKPKDERAVVAGGISIFVVAVIFIIWVIFFFKQIQSGTVNPTLNSGAQGDFMSDSVKSAGQQLQQIYGQSNSDDLTNLRDSAAERQVGATGQVQVQPQGGGVDQFGNSKSGF